MSEYFIVLSQEPERHDTLEEAQRQQRNLAAHLPDRTFTIHRCKTWFYGARHFPKMVELLNDIIRDGLTPEHRARGFILLLTVKNRSPRLKVTPRPEWQPPPGAKEPR